MDNRILKMIQESIDAIYERIGKDLEADVIPDPYDIGAFDALAALREKIEKQAEQ
jgi:hypothetical protein